MLNWYRKHFFVQLLLCGSATTVSMDTFSIISLSNQHKNAKISINDTQHNNTQHFVSSHSALLSECRVFCYNTLAY